MILHCSLIMDNEGKRVIDMTRILLLLLISGIIILSACGEETSTETTESGAIPIGVKSICRPYKARLEIADANYKDKIVAPSKEKEEKS